jgi:hypothetical protein
MNRRQRKLRVAAIMKRIVPLSKRVISAHTQYEKLRAEIETLPGDDPKRGGLHFKSAEILKERNAIELEHTALLRELERLGQAGEWNREVYNRDGKENNEQVKDGSRDNLESTGLHST